MKQSEKLFIPATGSVVGIERKKSRFIAELTPVNTRTDVQNKILDLANEHPEASHIVYAFCIGGLTREILGMSDDGEPKGTAGRPVLEVLRGRSVTNALISVVRYFGGTKLGTGGLVKSYGESAKRVLESAQLEELIAWQSVHCLVPYGLVTRVQRMVNEYGGQIESEQYAEDVEFVIRVAANQVSSFIRTLTNISSGTILFDE